MKIVDADVPLYSANRRARQHERWRRDAKGATESVGLPWVSLLAFVRIATNPGLRRRGDRDPGVRRGRELAGHPGVVTVAPTPRHASLLRGLVETHGAAGNLTTDAPSRRARAGAGAKIVTFDRGLLRFGVWVEPIT